MIDLVAGHRPVDLDPATRASLEFDALLADVASEARTAAGRSRVLGTRPSADPAAVRRALGAVDEVVRFVAAHGRLVPGALPDPGPVLELLPVADARPRARDLRDLAATLAFGTELRDRVVRVVDEHDGFDRLAALAGSIPDLSRLAHRILHAVEPDGRLADDASEGLRRIRREAARVGARLRGMLEGILRSPAAGATVQDEFVTQRNGRFVIPVRADAPAGSRGIVHATSSSGATLFVEPLESVELNNQLVRLGEAEQEESERILAAWTDTLRGAADDVRACVDRVAEVDALQARAVWGGRSDAVLPEIAADGDLLLEDVRHPLLDRRLRESGGGAVPVTLALDPWDRTLLLSGPNAGGKTVALKTLGLATLMAQSAIPVPARSARLPCYRQVRADIGDHQSLEADLSTFSAHLEAVRGFLAELSTPALVLFDEIGTGTDPAEGASLARAILERLGRDGVTVAATTHHGALKTWAFGRDRVVSAALEFDRETLRPTYRVLLGTAGVSAGIEVAERLGLDRDVVERARAYLGDEAASAEGYLERLREALADARRRSEELDRRERDLARAEDATEARIAREVARARDEAVRRLEESVASFRELGRRELDGIRDKRERERARRAQERAERRLATESARRKARLSERRKEDLIGPTEVRPPQAGDRVLVVSLDREGEVVAIRGERAEVRLGRVSFQVPLADVRPLTGAPPSAGASRPASAPRRAPENDTVSVGGELHLLGRTADEALPEIDRYLDRAVREGWPSVRLIHGHGTGRLRRAVREHLRRHPVGRRFRPGGPGEGGDGATVVELDGDG